MADKIFAVMSNYKGLTATEKGQLSRMSCEVGSVHNVKDVIFTDSGYDVVLDLYGIEITISGENVKLYKTYDGDDVIRYTPERQKQQGE